jgi:hypothetical protein
MKKKLPSAKAPLPEFRSDKEAAEYLETHSIADRWDQLPIAKQSKPSKALEKAIRERHQGQNPLFRFGWFPNKSRLPKKSPQRNRSAIRPNCGCGSPRGSGAKRGVRRCDLGIERIEPDSLI